MAHGVKNLDMASWDYRSSPFIVRDVGDQKQHRDSLSFFVSRRSPDEDQGVKTTTLIATI